MKELIVLAALFCVAVIINLRAEDTQTTKTSAQQHIAMLQKQGVTIEHPEFLIIDPDVTIGAGTVIGAGVHILRGSVIGKNCIIEPFTIIDHAVIADKVTIHSHSIIKNSQVHAAAEIGPFAHVHRNSIIEEGAVIGNFVEVSASHIGKNTKAKHLAYLGMTDIGTAANIGAGTITCNYNGVRKQRTTIKDHAFIGSNNTLIAPVTVGQGAYTAAGSTINQDVPDAALGIGRARQVNKEGYVQKLKTKYRDQEASK